MKFREPGMNVIHAGYPLCIGGDDMSGYRHRAGKPSAALWLLVVLADAGWAATSGTVAIAGTLAVLSLAALAMIVVLARGMSPSHAPVRVRARGDQRSLPM
jgi:hypothetical protein